MPGGPRPCQAASAKVRWGGGESLPPALHRLPPPPHLGYPARESNVQTCEATGLFRSVRNAKGCALLLGSHERRPRPQVQASAQLQRRPRAGRGPRNAGRPSQQSRLDPRGNLAGAPNPERETTKLVEATGHLSLSGRDAQEGYALLFGSHERRPRHTRVQHGGKGPQMCPKLKGI